jgi:protein ImuA
MTTSGFMARDGFARLRRRIAEIEGRGILAGTALGPERATGSRNGPGNGIESEIGNGIDTDPTARPALAPRRGGLVLPFAIPRLDAMLGGGIGRNALHEIRGEASRNGAATGFAAALLARLARLDDRPLLWISETDAAREAGHPHGIGLDRFGLNPDRIILVNVQKPGEALWVFEEGLKCRGLGAVLAEIRGHPRPLDLTASRRLALRARESGVMGLLLRQVTQAEPGAALTRWLVTPRPAGILGDYQAGIGRPAWHLTLERNRRGTVGAFDLEWDHDTCAFAAIAAQRPANPRPVAAAFAHRSPSPPGPRPRMAFRDAS